MGRKWLVPGLLALLGVVLAGAVVAEEDKPLTYDRVSLSAAAETEVPTDLLTAVLFAQREGSEAARLAQEVNQAIDWGVEEGKKVPQVTVRTLEYRTHPVYNKQTLTGWRVRQSIRLESADAPLLSELVGRLQERLAVDTIAYRLSPEVRRQAENEMIQRALVAFTARAKLIAGELGRPEYRLVKVDVNTGGATPRPVYRSAAMAMRVEAAPPPAIEPGTETVRVQVSGTIELRVQ